MKKIIAFTLLAVMLFGVCMTSVACGEPKKEYVAIDAQDLLTEDFGIAVRKGNDALMAAVNDVVDKWVLNGTMTKYVDYYTDLAAYEENPDENTAPVAGDLKLTWDFGNATETITVFTESGFAPFEFISGNDIIGVDIAIMNEVAENLGKKIEIKDIDFNVIPAEVQNSTGDAVGAAGLSITEERLEAVDFSDVYFSSTLVVMSAKEFSFSSLADLAGHKVGVQEGTSGDIIFSTAMSKGGYSFEDEDGVLHNIELVDPATAVVQYKQYALAFADLKAGRIDAILMDKLPAQTLIAMDKK